MFKKYIKTFLETKDFEKKKISKRNKTKVSTVKLLFSELKFFESFLNRKLTRLQFKFKIK